MFYRLKPKIIQRETYTVFPNNEYDRIKLKSCPKNPDMFGGCDQWNEGEGSTRCCSCGYAEWEVVKCDS